MSAIAYFLESEGIQTTGISLVRENTAALEPPRFLWASFPLGRPLGKPGDPAFQRRVILAALGLLERGSGPVLEDYPEDVPELAAEDTPACPVSFVAGTQSAEIRQGGMAMARALAHERLTWIEGTHLYPMERPAETARAVLAAIATFG